MYEKKVSNEHKNPIVALEPDERQMLLDHVNKEHTFRVEFTVRVLMETGLRVAELAHMTETWLDGDDPRSDDFEFGDGNWPLIRIPAHQPCGCTYCKKQARRGVERKNDAPNEGDHGYETAVDERLARYWKPKATSDRNVPVYSRRCWELLWEYFHERDDVGDTYDDPYHGDVKMVGVTPHALWRRVKRASEGMDFKHEVTSHAMRHTFGTMLAEREVPTELISRYLGHTDVRVTNVYIDLAGSVAADMGGKHLPDDGL